MRDIKKYLSKASLILIILLVSTVAIVCIAGFGKSDTKNYHLVLEINEILIKMDNPDIISIGNKYFFNKEKSEIKKLTKQASWINLNLKSENSITNINAEEFEAVGMLHLSGKTYPFKAVGTLDIININGKEILYYGPLRGEINTCKGYSNLILGVEFIPNSEKCHISLSVGNIDYENGMALMDFGELFIDKNLNNQIEQQLSSYNK